MPENLSSIQSFLSFILRHREALYLVIIAALSVVVVHLFRTYKEVNDRNEQILKEAIIYEREKAKAYEEIIKSQLEKQNERNGQ